MEPEEAYQQAAVIPLNMQPRYQASREVFDEFYNPYEQPQARLKPRQPSNEVMCMPKDDVGRTCPQLLPPEPVQMPQFGMCGGGGAGGGAGGAAIDPLWGDGYVRNYVDAPQPSVATYFPKPAANKARKGPWYFPRNPAQGALRPVMRPRAFLGPVGGSPDPTRCAPGTGGVLRLGMETGGAGAITSIRWRGYEFLRRSKRGVNRVGALQMSVASNIPPGGNDQQRRANEAGAAWNRAPNTSSRLLALATGRLTPKKLAAFTKTQAAWWRRPGAVLPGGRRVLNTVDLSPYTVTKRVTLGPSSFKYVAGVSVPPGERAVSLRLAMRLAVQKDLNRALAFHAPSQRWVALPRSRTLPVGKYRAVVVTNATGGRAIGFSLMDYPKPPVGWNFMPKAFYAVNVTNGRAGTILSGVHQVGVRGGAQPLPTRTYSYHTHFEIGTLEKVTRNLANLAINLTRHSQLAEVPRGWSPRKFRALCRAPRRKLWVNRGILKDPSRICGPRVRRTLVKPSRMLVRRMRAAGWKRVRGVWRKPGFRCRINRQVARCRTCDFRSLGTKRCGGCAVCTPVRRRPAPKGPKGGPRPPPASMTTVCTRINTQLRRCRRCKKHERHLPRCRYCFRCTKRRCRKVQHLPRCQSCGIRTRHLPRCRGCVKCTTDNALQQRRLRIARRRAARLARLRAVRARKAAQLARLKGARAKAARLARLKAARTRAAARAARLRAARLARLRAARLAAKNKGLRQDKNKKGDRMKALRRKNRQERRRQDRKDRKDKNKKGKGDKNTKQDVEAAVQLRTLLKDLVD